MDELPKDGQRVIAFVPENYVPLTGSPGQVELKPIKVLTFIKNFYGSHKPKHKNNSTNDFENKILPSLSTFTKVLCILKFSKFLISLEN